MSSFTTWYLRTTYLDSCRDGTGERLIHINSSILNTPGFKAAGWIIDPVERTHSPPIPTAVAAEYFRNGVKLAREDSRDEDEEGGMVTGRKSNDTIGPNLIAKRRRRREQIEDDDSSDLSDESDEDDNNSQRAAQQIKFSKMPARDRSGSAADRSSIPDQYSSSLAMVASPKSGARRRGGSLSAVESVKARARADTATSSEVSSENEIDPVYFRRRNLSIPKSGRPLPPAISHPVTNQRLETHREQDDSDADSVDSAASSELGDTMDSNDVLGSSQGPHLSSSTFVLPDTGTSDLGSPPDSPEKKLMPSTLQPLPPPRPISMIQPFSLLSDALRAQVNTTDPVRKYATLSGKGAPDPLWIKIYTPFSVDSESPFEMPVLRTSKDGAPTTVVEVIGLSLWQYSEEGIQPPLQPEQLNVNKWILRLVEDGEVEYDFPALSRTSVITDFTTNNNRGARARSRARPFDEFALVGATAREFEANKRETPLPAADESLAARQRTQDASNEPHVMPSQVQRGGNRNHALLGVQPFASALDTTGLTPADRPIPAGATSTPKLGAMKTVRVRYFDFDTVGQTTKIDISTDSYIAEILDQVCRRWDLDRAGFLLKVAGTNTVAPLDRTVEALGTRSDLDLVRKRFGGGPGALAGSPGSASPNAPLLLDIQGMAMRKGKKGQKVMHPLAQKEELMTSATNFKKYYVTRKRVTSFTQASARVLVFDGDQLHNMPADTGKTMIDASLKTNSFAFADIVRCKVSTKHSKLIRISVQRSAETKRYDFEARTAGEAQEIVDEINKEMRLARG